MSNISLQKALCSCLIFIPFSFSNKVYRISNLIISYLDKAQHNVIIWLFVTSMFHFKKSPAGRACPYPKLKRPSSHVAGRAFLRSRQPDLLLFQGVRLDEKALGFTSVRSGKDLGKDKLFQWKAGLFQ
ncbi:MAG: hypothetical protein M3Y54_16770 [Bacteroidota bacterium]|nr:hypothetical protein [Bacteroidota bacterium]